MATEIKATQYPREIASTEVTRLWWPVNSDIAIEDGQDGDQHTGDRIQMVLDYITEKVGENFGNVTDLDIAETDRFSARFETEDGDTYEAGYDMLSQWEDEGLALAMEKYPFRDGEDRTVRLDSDTAKAIRYVVSTTERFGTTYQDHLDDIEAWMGTWDDPMEIEASDPLQLRDTAIGRQIAGDPDYTDDGGPIYRCLKCYDNGMIETWGPNEGCREFMSEPEVWFCDCQTGKGAEAEKKAWDERVATARAATDKQIVIEFLINEFGDMITNEFSASHMDQPLEWWQGQFRYFVDGSYDGSGDDQD